ncbi:exopolyphosphatase [Desulfurispira natronophila]|uniref:Exopolyphosphatase/guanosine-5'-triphosphate, 3'-diphosphate pyrophosphatase n=1 Tax=Desulfurispira natronophila TaxID=682562 RepID=A0A7W8DG44_9BACT|nr:exopolyphosphatase [Desulfurispira natronophila]MBB5021015.1 exopolyphosphatase/guanosine-5'-triphosphate,3'-diphosphate pyrophosphatase [Desulfurispira natronophila]
MMKFAAIDIGSNAIRFLNSNVYINGDPMHPLVRKAALYRVPVRLGEDAFRRGRISKSKCDHLLHTMHAFRHLLQVFEPLDWMACATSAMREASNGTEIINRIYEETGVDINIIDGGTEAEMICSSTIAERLDSGRPYLYVDIGGGSTEISLFRNQKREISRSFNIGTIRILEGLVSSQQWKEMANWLQQITSDCYRLAGIGSGGNINKIAKMAGRREDAPLSVARLEKTHSAISSLTYEQRMRKLGLRPDRADVIVPAGEIILFVMHHCNINKLFVPKVGLSDGIIHHLYYRYTQQVAVSR